jgi:hypothetical protein
MGADNACFWKQDDLCGAWQYFRTKDSHGPFGPDFGLTQKQFVRSPTTMIDDLSGLKLVKSEQFA